MALDRCGDVLATGSPAALGYGAYEATGDVAAARSYAFLTDHDAVDGYPVLQVRQGNGVERALEVASGLFGAPAP